MINNTLKKHLIDEIINIFKEECTNKKHREHIEEHIVSPLIDFIIDKIRPYILITSIFFIIMITLIIAIIYLIILRTTIK